MAKSKPKSSIKLSSNWEKNMAALGTPAKASASKSSSSKSSSSKSSSSKPSKPASSAKVPAKSSAKPAASAKTPAKPATTPAKTPAVVAKLAKPAGKTVSQIWKEKTGMDWSEAKKLGLSDGSAKSNLALLAKLNSGATSRADLGVKVEPIVLATKKNEPMATPELETKRKGGPVKMKKGGMKKKSC